MSRVSQFSFAAGRINRNLIGRRDMDKYYNSAFEIDNYIVKRHGVLEKRHGFKLTATLSNTFPQTRIIPFYWENDRCNYLLLSVLSIIVVDDKGEVVQELDYPQSDIISAWTPSEIDKLDYCQIGDIVFFASRARPPFRVRRRGVADFVAETIQFEDITRNTENAPVLSAKEKAFEEGTGSKKRTIKYRASEVVGGKEMFIGETLEIENVWWPWAEGGKIVLEVAQKSKNDVDGYRFYRNEGSGWGYIGSTEDSYSGIERHPAFTSVVTDTGSGYWLSEEGFSGAEKKNFRVETLAMQFYDATTILSITREGNIHTITLKKLKHSMFRIDLADAAGVSLLDESTLILTSIDVGSLANEYGFTELSDGSGWSYEIEDEDTEVPERFYNTILSSLNNEITKAVRVQSRAFTDETKVFVKLIAHDTAFDSGVAPKLNLDASVNMISFINDLMQFTDDYIQGDYSKTVPNYRNPFDSNDNYPGVVGVYQQRMVWASTNNDPSMFWMSVPGDLYNFSVHSNIQEDDMINAALPLSRGPKILHMISHRYLIMLCENAECVVKAQGDSGLSYATISCEQQSYTGSSTRVRPLLCGNAIIFCDRAGASAREYKYDYAMDAMAGRDMSVLNSELLERSGGIVDWTYQMFPDSIIWSVLADGTLALFTYMPEQEVYAWSTASLPKGFKAVGIACGDALQDSYNFKGERFQMSSVAILAKKDGDNLTRYIFTVDGSSFLDVVENGEKKPVEARVECVVPDSQGSTEARRKRVFRVILRGENLEDVTFGLRDRDGKEEPMAPSRQESSFVDAQLMSDYCYDPQIIIHDATTKGTSVMNLCTDMDCMDVGF